MKKIFNWNKLAAWVILVVLVALIGFGVWCHFSLLNRVCTLKGDANQQELTDVQAMVDYLREERSTLIWMLGVIITGVAAMLTFLGLATRKDVENRITEKYDKVFQDRINGVIEKEAIAKKKQILFVYQSGENNRLQSTNEFFSMNGYLTRSISAANLQMNETDIKRTLSGSTIVVYQVADSVESLYLTFAKICQEYNYQCIVYTGQYQIDRTSLAKYENTTTVNFPSTLRQQLYTLLYFSP